MLGCRPLLAPLLQKLLAQGAYNWFMQGHVVQAQYFKVQLAAAWQLQAAVTQLLLGRPQHKALLRALYSHCGARPSGAHHARLPQLGAPSVLLPSVLYRRIRTPWTATCSAPASWPTSTTRWRHGGGPPTATTLPRCTAWCSSSLMMTKWVGAWGEGGWGRARTRPRQAGRAPHRAGPHTVGFFVPRSHSAPASACRRSGAQGVGSLWIL